MRETTEEHTVFLQKTNNYFNNSILRKFVNGDEVKINLKRILSLTAEITNYKMTFIDLNNTVYN
ncbi:hypothetical protein RBH29_15100 [Herbivorax sp. ANBcel31]|uniref:hypothetical protein n=1 Tax=Herbivorax sp. ANBcel31 TaxID=3069754 RepID=UPI0027B1B58B|nr:hypothetical protein [Herbivorax sp. ANBcel31]MDQ2087756.1 hypothetical protein [Herbivorax sp. ANBcel31]